uniref:Uncharacterized protein n=1 Tax=Knipowitschia caucasica TaxID=637954 RepID=A0AAV2KFH2_KNICA
MGVTEGAVKCRLLAPAVYAVMCRMWAIFKELIHGHRLHSKGPEQQIESPQSPDELTGILTRDLIRASCPNIRPKKTQ